ncbi:hypothetical protein AB1I58_07125 [Enterococcus hirae]|uniref:hypothetical protein n=1 Tax=Enterococcus hirae TaxID=1354 RepID=UPI0019DF8314|nr:hypothetical protein [Enterococcus hirae]
MEVNKTANQIEVISHYDQLNVWILTIGKVSKNQTWQISNAYLLPLSTENATDKFANSILASGDPFYPYEIRNFTKDIWGNSRNKSQTTQLILSDSSDQLCLTIDPTVGIGNYRYTPTDSV